MKAEIDWRGGEEEKRLYWRVREERKQQVRERFERMRPHLGERARRLFAANEALSFGTGGVRSVGEALGLATKTIMLGKRELQMPRSSERDLMEGRERRPGGGRKSILEKYPELPARIEQIVDPETRGDPMKSLRWVSKSLPHIVEELVRQGYPVSMPTVSKILQQNLGYSAQGLRKTREGNSHPDRDAQFQHINRVCQEFQQRGQPVISVDGKKKEPVGDFKNGGQEWQPKGKPGKVRTHDFVDKELGKVTPYGVYDIAQNKGWVSVGIDHDTAEFAVDSIRQWWKRMGQPAYPKATELLITADSGGSNAARSKLWKYQLQKFADESRLRISTCHFPPGTSKWNKIEHRLFCHITANWRGRPLETREVVVNLIANTRTSKGLTVKADLNLNSYEKGIVIPDEEIERLNITRDDFHGEWNYALSPRSTTS